MGIGVSVFLIAVGAILAFAVNVTTNGFDVNTIGVILMIVGAIGLLTSLFIFGGSSFGGAGAVGGRRRVIEDSYVEDDGVLEPTAPAVGSRRRRVVRRRDDII